MNKQSQSLMPFMDILTTLVGIIILMTIILAFGLVESDTVEVRLHHRKGASAASVPGEPEVELKTAVTLRPVYVVCEQNGIRIGENHYELATTKAQLRDLREILDAEVELAGEGGYLFALMRPDGYQSFQQLREIVDDLGIRFGYEPISSSWKLVE